ncbi:hypothetical protein BOX15_Mlig028219g2, partial [Macrostomum lignano]
PQKISTLKTGRLRNPSFIKNQATSTMAASLSLKPTALLLLVLLSVASGANSADNPLEGLVNFCRQICEQERLSADSLWQPQPQPRPVSLSRRTPSLQAIFYKLGHPPESSKDKKQQFF